MKSFYGDIVVTEKRRIRLSLDSKKKPTEKELIKMLNNCEYNDITDEETLKFLTVEEIDLSEGDEDAT